MREEERRLHGGLTARQGYRSTLEVDRTRIAAQNIINFDEYTDLQHTVFPFDKEDTTQPLATTAPVTSAASLAVTGVGEVAQKVSLFATVNGAFIQFGIPIVAAVLIGGGVGLGIASVVNNMAVQDQVKTYASEANDSGESGDSAAFVASKDPLHPVKVEIPEVSIDADTTQVGINDKGNIGAPASIKQLAWYDKSTSPVDSVGTAVIVGHVGTKSYAGKLSELHKVSENALIKVTMGDGKIFNYKVTTIEDIPADTVDMAHYLPNTNQTTKRLVIITCAGNYNARTYNYDDRLIVTAQAID
ncbi:MAG: class F sortase [Candidatus Microsaccharimonas sp.]